MLNKTDRAVASAASLEIARRPLNGIGRTFGNTRVKNEPKNVQL